MSCATILPAVLKAGLPTNRELINTYTFRPRITSQPNDVPYIPVRPRDLHSMELPAPPYSAIAGLPPTTVTTPDLHSESGCQNSTAPLHSVESSRSQNDYDPLLSDVPPAGPTPYEYAPIKDSFWPELDPIQWVQFPAYAKLYSAVRRSTLPNHLQARLTVPTDLHLDRWDALLKDYHDHELLEFLRYGWPVGFTASAPPPFNNKNHDTATNYSSHVQAYIKKELKLGGLLGPFTAPPFKPWTNTAPLMTTPKKETTARRIVLDLSFPDGTGVNGGITKHCLEGKLRPYTLPSVEDLATKIKLLGPKCYLWKGDLSRAYHQWRTDPGDLPLLGMKFNGLYYIDLCPSFGARLSSSACQRTTNAVVYLLAKSDHWALSYLDDFCGAATTLKKAQADYTAFLNLCSDLGLGLSSKKCQPPTQIMEWLGFRFNTIDMSITVPDAKLSEIEKECSLWLSTKLASVKSIQSLVGKIVHVSKCIPPARKFICRILQTLRCATTPGPVFITDTFRMDVRWFYQYARLSNGLHLLQPTRHDCVVECDSTLTGGGGNSYTKYYTHQYTHQEKIDFPLIVHLEAVNLVTAYRSLVPDNTPGFTILIYTDNMASSQALQTGRATDRILGMCSRQLWLEAARRDHKVVIKHKPGVDLPLADALSRQHDKSKRLYSASEVKKRGLAQVPPLRPLPMFDPI